MAKSELKKIRLDMMSGYQFQEFVANLFKQLGFSNVKLGPRGADAGIDITMEQKDSIGVTNRYLVECKHHPESAIGRPIVQKLYAAVASSQVLDKGIIVTSGHFSSEAVKYAEDVGIEPIDGKKLIELAKKVGLAILMEPSSQVENSFPISKKQRIQESLLSFLRNDLRGFNENLTEIIDTNLVLIPTYMVDYSINATFSTSAGMIHSINESSSIFILGDSGSPVSLEITNVMLPFKHAISEIDQSSLKDIKIKKLDFVKTHQEIQEPAKNFLTKAYTRKVSYRGANNVVYTKMCTPNKKDIILHDTKQVYLPCWRITFSLSKSKYAAVGFDTPSELNILPISLAGASEPDIKLYPDNCMICSKGLQKQKFVCNDCGKIICKKDSFQCKVCGKTVCKEHVVRRRRFMVLSKKYCLQCAPK